MATLHVPEKIHGDPVIAYAVVCDRGVVLVSCYKPHKRATEWVTGLIDDRTVQHNEWVTGHYFSTLEEAQKDFKARVAKMLEENQTDFI